jgi:hypothetical protein
MANNNIELHIEKLMLHGFSPSDRHRIGEAVEVELTRLFTEQGISMTKGGEFARLDGGQFNVAPNSNANTIGSQVAQSVYNSMNISQSH